MTGLDHTVLSADLCVNSLAVPLWIVLRMVVLSPPCLLACGMTFAHKGKLWVFQNSIASNSGFLKGRWREGVAVASWKQ